jgi:hypothetical protein
MAAPFFFFGLLQPVSVELLEDESEPEGIRGIEIPPNCAATGEAARTKADPIIRNLPLMPTKTLSLAFVRIGLKPKPVNIQSTNAGFGRAGERHHPRAR